MAGLIVAAGCGGGSGSSTPKPTYKVALVKSDVAYAKRTLAEIPDLGVDWYPAAAAPASSEQPLPACLRRANPGATKTGDSGTSVRYVEGSSLQVMSAADVFKTAGQAHQVMAAYRSAGFERCFKATYQKTLRARSGSGTTFGAVSIAKLPVTPVGDEVAAYRITVPITAGSGDTVYADLVFARAGRLISKLAFTATAGPFATQDEDRITSAVTARAMLQEHPQPVTSLTDTQMSFLEDLLGSYMTLHQPYVARFNRCNATAASPTSWASCVDRAYHQSGLLEKSRQMLVAVDQVSQGVAGQCGAALRKLRATLKDEGTIEFRVHDVVSHLTSESLFKKLVAADNANVPRMFKALDKVSSRCLGL